jgi:rfaE bifunctional protein nucleotidyltransferase chain/domain
MPLKKKRGLGLNIYQQRCDDKMLTSDLIKRVIGIPIMSANSLELQSRVDEYKKKGLKIAHCHGVFDLLHIGHIRHFKEAKKLGDVLFVSITADKYVNKGPDRPRFTEALRAEALAALEVVDVVVISYSETALEAIEAIKPAYYIKGSEYKNHDNDITGKIRDEKNAVEKAGGKIIYTNDITFSSSSLINLYFSPYPPEVMNYINVFKKKYSADYILECIDRLSDLSVLVVGEAIIDEYIFCDAIGKAGKEPVLVSKYKYKEKYAGGILAVANHVSSFCEKTTCLTYLGDKDSELEFINKHLKSKVKLEYVVKPDSPTITKLRYLEEYNKQKLFEIYKINDEVPSLDQVVFRKKLEEQILNHDIVIVADYGHGLLDEGSIDYLCKNSKFLAVNTQANAGNHGFNCIVKYPRADYICIAHRELALTIRDRSQTPESGLKYLAENYQYKNIVVTAGVAGSITYKRGEPIKKVPAFATSIKDRVGAGDSVLAITSLCMIKNYPAEVIGFIGNMVGAQAVNVMGNKTSIEKTSLKKFISHTLK